MRGKKITVMVCETQPATAVGVRALLRYCPDMEFVGAADSIAAGRKMADAQSPSVVLLDKAFGSQAVLECVAGLPEAAGAVVWGAAIDENETLHLLRNGVLGVIRKTAPAGRLIECLRAVGAGQRWMEESIFQDEDRRLHHSNTHLTPREQQVADLVEQGLRNKDVAERLGIQTGTVKIHMKHIFEKTGVRRRGGLALCGMKEREMAAQANG